MELAKITQVTGQAVPVPGDDIDTDRIIPARFMKCVTFDGLGDFLFYDARRDNAGELNGHPLDDPKFAGATILISGNNFGCGSSREHAPQALYRAGFRAVIAIGFAEIFFGNCTSLGIPCVSVSSADQARLVAAVKADPATVVSIDLEAKEIRFGDAKVPCEIRDGAREALRSGRWDPLGDLMEGSADVDRVAGGIAYLNA